MSDLIISGQAFSSPWMDADCDSLSVKRAGPFCGFESAIYMLYMYVLP